MGRVADNLARVQESIAKSASQHGRSAEEITLVAVTKKQTAETVREALLVGASDIGENYVQEAHAKRNEIDMAGMPAARWHLLGHLQSNKARAAVETFGLIQSVDSVKLARIIGRQAVELGCVQEILLQVHLGDEITKSGVEADRALDVAAEIINIDGINICGLMGIAPQGEDPRPYFQQLRRLFDTLPTQARHILSMGMTADFDVAIEEGATMVRVGTAIFGSRSA